MHILCCGHFLNIFSIELKKQENIARTKPDRASFLQFTTIFALDMHECRLEI